jgi:hypothetical protein
MSENDRNEVGMITMDEQLVNVLGVEYSITHRRPALFLNGMGITRMEEIEGFQYLTYLEQLDLSGNKLRHFPRGSEAGTLGKGKDIPPCLKFITWLDVSDNDLASIEWIDTVPSVRTLLLHGNPRIDPDALVARAKACLGHLAFLSYDRNGARKARFFKTVPA